MISIPNWFLTFIVVVLMIVLFIAGVAVSIRIFNWASSYDRYMPDIKDLTDDEKD